MTREYKYNDGILNLKCSMCWKRKPTTDFNKDKHKMLWFRNECKECRRGTIRSYYENNKNSIIKYGKLWAEKHKDKVNGYKVKYRNTHKELVAACQKNNRDSHSNELWFNWDTFHQRAIKYVSKHKIRPKECPICWKIWKVVIHHPSYEKYEYWSMVVFCCQSCHKGIHSWRIWCPNVVNLLKIKV